MSAEWSVSFQLLSGETVRVPFRATVYASTHPGLEVAMDFLVDHLEALEPTQRSVSEGLGGDP